MKDDWETQGYVIKSPFHFTNSLLKSKTGEYLYSDIIGGICMIINDQVNSEVNEHPWMALIQDS
jgi:hypothetical protein